MAETKARSLSSSSSSVKGLKFETLKVTMHSATVCHVEINRPAKRNAMNKIFWKEMVDCFSAIGKDLSIRVVVISAAGVMFTAGLDLSDHMDIFTLPSDGTFDPARRGYAFRQLLLAYQQTFSILEQIPQPVIVAVHGQCIGGGVDLICAADIRLCSSDAVFCIKEVDIGMTADVGTFPRLQKVIGSETLVREWALTGRNIPSAEAERAGLVSRVLKDKQDLMQTAFEMATTIASKSPVATVGIKQNLNFMRDHSVQDGLAHVVLWNMSQIQTADMAEGITAFMSKRPPIFSSL